PAAVTPIRVPAASSCRSVRRCSFPPGHVHPVPAHPVGTGCSHLARGDWFPHSAPGAPPTGGRRWHDNGSVVQAGSWSVAQQFPTALHRSPYLCRGGTPDVVTGIDRTFQRQHLEHILLDLITEAAQLLQTHLGQVLAAV